MITRTRFGFVVVIRHEEYTQRSRPFSRYDMAKAWLDSQLKGMTK